MIKRLVLLPGMDGTGDLFADFVKALPAGFETDAVRYPTNDYKPYFELMEYILTAVPSSEPFVLIAESFSTPLAVQFAAMNPSNLKGLVICAGFVTSPAHGLLRFFGSLFAPLLFRVPFSQASMQLLLVGPGASSSLQSAVHGAISSVRRKVLSARLQAVLVCDTRNELKEVTVPILYIQAEHDHLVPPSSLEEILRIQPRTILATIAGPHLILQREPQKAAEIIAGFTHQLASGSDH
jgi:pimeloyl-[acyl-carrier protein] methyl ester esterase